jgi:predicted glycoside hydrolase/deacetylase ChbG (UPF0249 family)
LKSLIVNADDLGMSLGINRGIVEAHTNGILTSASLMVNRPAAEDAAGLSTQHPALGVGLHVELPTDSPSPQIQIEGQLERFTELTGRNPTHIDAHHNVHRKEDLLPAFLAVARRLQVPLRGYCRVHHINSFYGQWEGEARLEHVSPAAIERIVGSEIRDGFNELMCHPGYANDLQSSYLHEREAELATLCDPGVAALLARQEVRLVTFREVPQA